jgi:hypothetical protein
MDRAIRTVASSALLLDRPRLLGVFAAAPIVGGVVILLVRAAFLEVDLMRPPFAGVLAASLIAWPLLVVVCVACTAMVRPATLGRALRRGGITGAIAGTVGWVSVVALIEGLFLIDASGMHRSMADPEEIARSLAPFLLPLVALLGFVLGGLAAIAAWSGRMVFRVHER